MTLFPFESSRMLQSTQPTRERLTGWLRDNRRALVDLLVLLVGSGLTIWLAIAFDATEAFYAFSRQHESWQLDDIVLTAGLTLSVGGLIFAIRRWNEAAHLLAQASTDSLTDVLNRRRGWELMQIDARRAQRYGRPLSLVMIDIDHFKVLNDTYGHQAGDRALTAVVKGLQTQLRGTDILMRWGGDEFVIACVETDLSQARRLAERLRVAVETNGYRQAGSVTASFGVVQLAETESVEALLGRADERLYAAKSQGRNQVG